MAARFDAIAARVRAVDERVTDLCITDDPLDAALQSAWATARERLQTDLARLADAAQAALAHSVAELTKSSQAYFESSAARLGIHSDPGPGH